MLLHTKLKEVCVQVTQAMSFWLTGKSLVKAEWGCQESWCCGRVCQCHAAWGPHTIHSCSSSQHPTDCDNNGLKTGKNKLFTIYKPLQSPKHALALSFDSGASFKLHWHASSSHSDWPACEGLHSSQKTPIITGMQASHSGRTIDVQVQAPAVRSTPGQIWGQPWGQQGSEPRLTRRQSLLQQWLIGTESLARREFQDSTASAIAAFTATVVGWLRPLGWAFHTRGGKDTELRMTENHDLQWSIITIMIVCLGDQHCCKGPITTVWNIKQRECNNCGP